MRFFNWTILFIIQTISSSTFATSCLTLRSQFIVKCENDICVEGFFKNERYSSSGIGCNRVLDVQKEDPIHRINGNLASVKSTNEILNGYYSVQSIYPSRYYRRREKDNRCFKNFSEENSVNLECFKNPSEFKKLNYPTTETVESVQQEYVTETKHDYYISWIIKWAFGPLLLALMYLNIKSKKRIFYATAFWMIFYLSLIGILGYISTGWASWLFSGLTSLIILPYFKRK